DFRGRQPDAAPDAGRPRPGRRAAPPAGRGGGRGMILLCGIPSEPPLAMVIAALGAMGARHVVFNQRRFANAYAGFEICAGRMSGWLEIDGMGYPLDSVQGVYTRLMDFRKLPELKGVAENAREYRYCAALHDTLTRWCEISPARIVNRVAPMGSN